MFGKLVLTVVFWLALTAGAWFLFLRQVPESPTEWLLLVALGPPAYLFASALGEGLFKAYERLPVVRHLHAFVETRAAGRELSWLRVVVYLVTMLGFSGIIFVIGSALHLL